MNSSLSSRTQCFYFFRSFFCSSVEMSFLHIGTLHISPVFLSILTFLVLPKQDSFLLDFQIGYCLCVYCTFSLAIATELLLVLIQNIRELMGILSFINKNCHPSFLILISSSSPSSISYLIALTKTARIIQMNSNGSQQPCLFLIFKAQFAMTFLASVWNRVQIFLIKKVSFYS